VSGRNDTRSAESVHVSREPVEFSQFCSEMRRPSQRIQIDDFRDSVARTRSAALFSWDLNVCISLVSASKSRSSSLPFWYCSVTSWRRCRGTCNSGWMRWQWNSSPA
jgi:hypothetical protein